MALGSATALAACGSEQQSGAAGPSAPATGRAGAATGTFPLTVSHEHGETVVESAPQRVVVGLTEQDVLLELGVVPIATTEWYGEEPGATWEWARDLLGGATPEVLDQSDGPQTERIAALAPDLIVGTNAGMTREPYDTLSQIAPTVTSVTGAEDCFSDWRDGTRQIAAAVGRSAAGEDLVAGVEEAYAAAAAAHPEFAGLQAQISAERIDLIDADVIVFATEEEGAVETLLGFGTLRSLDAVAGGGAVSTGPVLSGPSTS